MALKDILVCLDPTEAGEARLRLAAAIVRQHRAHLSAAYILPEVIPGGAAPDALTVAPPTGEAWMPQAGMLAGVPAPGVMPSAGADAPRAAVLADIVEQRFRTEVQPHAIEADWHILGPGDGTDLVSLAMTVDLIIVGQASPDYRQPTGFRPEDIVVASGRPALVVPYAGDAQTIGRRVLVAWDGTREAARAMHDALPLLGKAERITVVTVRDDEAALERDAPSIARLVAHLRRHDLAATSEQTLRGDVPIADVLLSRASDLEIDLIVAGAYHRSQLREALLGGVSRDLLHHMTVPVLMAH